MIRVLIVDDSLVARKHIEFLLSGDPGISIAGTAGSGAEALDFLARNRVDLVTMDVEMPGMNGFDATARIMETTPLPIVIITSGWTAAEIEKTFRALQVGALAILMKPPGPGSPDYPDARAELLKTVKSMAGVRVSRRPGRPEAPGTRGGAPAPPIPIARANIRMVAIGASTGGPAALCELLQGLPRPLPVPVLVVQHITAGFIGGFATWLSHATGFEVTIPAGGELPLPGVVYLAPDGRHMLVDSSGGIALSDGPPEHGMRPSVSRLFASVAERIGPAAIGILLTGMGQDGAEELAAMRARGAVTVAQDRASSVVFGMPGEAVRRNAAMHVLNPQEIAVLVAGCLQRKREASDPGSGASHG